jgi:hemolysin III
MFARSRKEEVANSISHGVGVILSLAALVMLAFFAGRYGNGISLLSLSIYGVSLLVLYAASTLYHGFRGQRSKSIFRVIDHSAVYLLIAGTYTPVALLALRGGVGWVLFGVVWTLAAGGIIGRLLFLEKFKTFSVILYLVMGWLVLAVYDPLMDTAPKGLFKWLLAGGLCYTLGVIFYIFKRVPYFHFVWHLFVLAGSIVHFLGILFYLTLR